MVDNKYVTDKEPSQYEEEERIYGGYDCLTCGIRFEQLLNRGCPECGSKYVEEKDEDNWG